MIIFQLHDSDFNINKCHTFIIGMSYTMTDESIYYLSKWIVINRWPISQIHVIHQIDTFFKIQILETFSIPIKIFKLLESRFE